MPIGSIERVIDAWAEQINELGSREEIRYVQVFENRGAMMGASNPHPHGQIWATEHIPNEPRAEFCTQHEHYAVHGRPLLLDYLTDELELGTRIVYANADFVVLVPFWAVWPFETLVLPRRSVATLIELTSAERTHLADALSTLTRAYDRIFDTPFPYSMGLHPAPTDGKLRPEWTFHIHFYPPLLRSATVRKFMVGFELLGSPQRDITPEFAAETLRNINKNV
jgi:UDPglucose--hexose-1-phosphate uridylyltransferase